MARPSPCRCREAVARPPPVAAAAALARSAGPARPAPRPLPLTLIAGTAIGARGPVSLRAASVRQTQAALGNRSAQRVVQRLREPALARSAPAETMVVQRDSLNPLDWARQVLSGAGRDASGEEAAIANDSRSKASELEGRGTTDGAQLQGQSTAQGAVLQGEAAAQGAQVEQQTAAQGSALNTASAAQAARLNSESTTRGAALQQEASGASARLNAEVGALDSSSRASEAAAAGALTADATALQTESEASGGAVEGQWSGLEAQATARMDGMTNRTQSLIDQKTALVAEYRRPGAHDPERFQQRWRALQAQIAPLEAEQAHLGQAEAGGESITERAGSMWARLSQRGQALLGRASGLASTAWSAIERGWSTVQGGAAAALAGLQSRAGAAVATLRGLADSAAAGLQGAATQAWSGAKAMATAAWTGLQGRATAAWTALQTQASSAWTALQGAAGTVVGALSERISSAVSRISGTVGRIVDLISDAVGSLLSRLRSATSSALSALRSRASAAWNGLKGLGSRAWEGLKGLGSRAWEGLKNLGSRAWEGLKNLGSRAWEGLKNLGSRAWNGLKSLGQRAWNALKSGWDWVKRKAQAAWAWLKNAWETVKRKAAQAWEWVKRKAAQALAWLKKKWAWLKSALRRAWDWLKAKWRWLKELVKITIRIPDQTLCKVHNFKPWKFVDLHSGRLPIVKTIVDPGIGPVELALFVQADAEATIGGTVGPCTLKNIAFTLQPLVSRYTGQADFHMAGAATEKLSLTGTLGGTANYGGLIALAAGGLQGTGAANALGSFSAKPRFVYDSGNITASLPIRLEFCLMPTIDLHAFVTAKLIAGLPPAAAPAPSPSTPLLPGPSLPTLPGPAPRLPGVPALAGPSSSPATKPKEEVLKEWTKRWHLAHWQRRECWDTQANFTLTAGPGALPELDMQFSAKPVSLAEVVRSMFDLPPLPGGGGGSGGGYVGPLGATYACAICKCSGDTECGGGRIHTIWMGKTECNRENKKKAQQLCNHDSTFLSICDLNQKRPDGKKCSVHHHDFACSERETEDKCTNRQQSLDVTDLGITHKTALPAPDGSGRERTDVGVGEKVTFTGSEVGRWTATAGTPAVLPSDKTFVWTAPGRATAATIKLEAGGREATVAMNVIEPASITGSNKKEIGYPAGRQGAGMKLTFNYHPKTVSFGNVEAKEVSGPATNIKGYFLHHGMPHWHDSGDTFFPIGADNKDTATDTASFNGYPAPWDTGSWDWQIPNHFKLKTEGGDGKLFTTVTQAFSMTPTGKSTVDKAGLSVTRSP